MKTKNNVTTFNQDLTSFKSVWIVFSPRAHSFFVDFASSRICFIVVMVNIEKIKPQVEQICRRLPVKQLGLFGSVLKRDFSRSSDVDVLVIFDSGEEIDLFDGYFELKDQLEKIFKREVDLVVDKEFINPILRESIDRSRLLIYER